LSGLIAGPWRLVRPVAPGKGHFALSAARQAMDDCAADGDHKTSTTRNDAAHKLAPHHDLEEELTS
jgi:hypothetical protein